MVVILSVPYCEPYPLVAPILLSSCLRQEGIDSVGIDFSIELVNELGDKPYWVELRNFFAHGYLSDTPLPRRALIDVLKFTRRFIKNLKKYNPTWIGLSIFTGESIDFGLILSYYIRKYFPEANIIAGGKGLEVRSSGDLNSDSNAQVWVKEGIADTVIVGDCETEIIDVIKNNKVGLVKSNRQTKEDLDKIPLPSWQDYDLKKYTDLARHRDQENKYDEPYVAITSSKGCVRKCTFCDVASFWPNYIYRNPENVANEIISSYHATGIKKFKFTDNLINGSVSNYREINRILAEKIPNQISYGGQAIFRGKHQMPEEDFDLASLAGCKMWGIGVESGSERVRYEMRKKFNDEDLDWSIKQLHRVGIRQDWLLIVGYPTETEEDFQLTVEMFKRYAHLNSNQMIRYVLNPGLRLLENSPLFSELETINTHGLSHNIDNEFYQQFWTSSVNPDNTYDVRIDRWKRLNRIVEDLGYTRSELYSIGKWEHEIDNLLKIYNEKKSKIIPIRSV